MLLISSTHTHDVWGQSYASPICSFGEAVYFKISASRIAKLNSSWFRGVWLGKDSVTNGHLAGSSSGEVLRVRTIRRLPATSQWQPALLLEAKGTPDSPSGSGDLDPKFILGEESLSFRMIKGASAPEQPSDGQVLSPSSGGGSAR